MRIATYNVNGINGRLANLLGWLEEAAPDIVCLHELKAPDEKFPASALRAAGYGAVWHGQKSWNGVAILSRGDEPEETRRGLPGDPDDRHSRYIEAAIGGLIVGCLYLPNGNPAPDRNSTISCAGSIASQAMPKACWTAARRWAGLVDSAVSRSPAALRIFPAPCFYLIAPDTKSGAEGQAVWAFGDGFSDGRH